MTHREASDLLGFATEFWQTVGGRLTREENAFRVEIPAELRQHFGKETLRFALTARDAWVSGAEILAPGSFLLERMYEFLQDKGARALFASQRKLSPTPAEVRREVARRLSLGNGKVAGMTSSEAWPVRLTVDFKLVYQSDDREEELVRVVEADDGELRVAEAEPHAPWPDAEVATAEIAARLETRQVADTYQEAIAVARRHAVARAKSFEKAALGRLSENLARLRGYFTQIRNEVGGDEERRAERLRDLEVEERLKTEEEIDAHRLRVHIQPIAVALCGVPTRRVRVLCESSASSAGGEIVKAEAHCDWNLATGAFEVEGIGAVTEEGIAIVVCRGGHAVRAEDGRACVRCGAMSCASHGVDCPALSNEGTCGARTCVSCGGRCTLCDRRYCPAHVPVACAKCGRAACSECGSPCATCGQWGCRGDSAACAVCGRRACAAHVVHCGCGETVCQGDVVVDAVSQIRYCGKCAIACGDCGRPMGKATSSLCAHCGTRLCRDDARGCKRCAPSAGKLCKAHRTRCNACGHDACRSRHRRRCKFCGLDVCTHCTDSHGRCAACLALGKSRELVAPSFSLPAEAAAVKEWHGREGADFNLYLGKARGGTLLLVTDKQGKVVRLLRR